MSKISGIKCEKCKNIHDQKDDTFFTVSGNILIGLHGGIIGNNIISKQDSPVIINDSHYCTNCLIKILQESVDESNKPTILNRKPISYKQPF